MPNYCCSVGGCDNDSAYPKTLVKRSHATELKFYYFPKDDTKRQLWKKQVDKGLERFVVTNNKFVCFNHFEFEKPTYASPIPTLFMTMRKAEEHLKGNEEKWITKNLSWMRMRIITSELMKKLQRRWKFSVDYTYPQQWYLHIWQEILMLIISLALRTVTFLVWFLKICQTRTMHYWKGLSNTSGDLSSPREPKNVNLRFLTLEQEFLLTMMRSRLGLLAGDLANRFKVSNSLVSSVFTTWVRLMSLELRWLINYPNCNIIRRNLPSMLRKYYPNCCVIIDCLQLFIETPSSLD